MPPGFRTITSSAPDAAGAPRRRAGGAVQPNDAEDCAACGHLDDTCPYHEGVNAGVGLAARVMRALADE